MGVRFKISIACSKVLKAASTAHLPSSPSMPTATATYKLYAIARCIFLQFGLRRSRKQAHDRDVQTTSRLIPKNEFRKMPWKNGGGITFEIDREPDSADYRWRLSQGLIEVHGEFSKFPGYQRILGICSGDGIDFHHKNLKPGQILNFDGDRGGGCELLGGPVLDLGLIYDPKSVSARMKNFTKSETFQQPADISYLFAVQGDWRCGDLSIPQGACLKLVNPKAQSELHGEGSLFLVTLRY